MIRSPPYTVDVKLISSWVASIVFEMIYDKPSSASMAVTNHTSYKVPGNFCLQLAAAPTTKSGRKCL